MKLGTETGSVVNHFMATAKQIEPAIGMGATICYWTDRRAATIVKVTRCQIHVQEDIARRVDTNGMSECQEYEYEPDPNGAVTIFRKTKRGWKGNGAGLLIGSRQHYYDYSF